MSVFWKGKDPCWLIMGCPDYVHKNCPAFLFPERPCWEVPYTRCEVLTSIHKDCKYCKVYHLYYGLGDFSAAE